MDDFAGQWHQGGVGMYWVAVFVCIAASHGVRCSRQVVSDPGSPAHELGMTSYRATIILVLVVGALGSAAGVLLRTRPLVDNADYSSKMLVIAYELSLSLHCLKLATATALLFTAHHSLLRVYLWELRLRTSPRSNRSHEFATADCRGSDAAQVGVRVDSA